MNLHAPQDVESESELRNLAAIPYQIISPANNTPIIGIFQDSLLGCNLFTRDNIRFTPRQAMNLLMMFQRVNENKLLESENKNYITSYELLSQILPPMTLKYKTKLDEMLEIKNGEYLHGRMEKSVLGGGQKGILQRICNDFGNMAAANFIDDLQNIITQYMVSTAYSVGISDLISNKETSNEIIKIITEKKNSVKSVIEQTQIGVFENNTGKTNNEEFESQVNNILNQATADAGKVGIKSLDKNNRFVTMVSAGSKGSDLNITQMLSCLGQQNVDGRRIPYGFDSRTLPHYSKYDDGPSARGFVESSYINGLSPQELFFHAMGGRVGLIDTAVKSVVWDTPIVIIENQQAKYIEIGRWIDEQLDTASPEKVQHFTDRQMELMNLKNGNVYIPTTDEDGIITWGEVSAITRHDPGTELYEIKTCGGRSVIVTESKSLLIWNPETKKLKEMLTPDIKVGDCVPVSAELCQPPIIVDNIDMTKYFSKGEYVYGTDFNKALEMMQSAMTERSDKGKCKISSGWWDENNGIHFTLPYTKKSSLQRTSVRSNLENIKDGYIYPYGAKRRNILMSDTFALNEENGIFIGLFLAEGNAYKSIICITNVNENIKSFVKNWFDKHSINWTEKTRINHIGGTTSSIIGASSILSTFLTKLVGHGAEHKYVPTEAFIAPECFIIGLLNGYFSGDGTVSKNSIEVGSASKRLIEGISMLCSRLGVFGKVFKTQLKSNNLGTINIKPTYRFSIRAQWGKIFAEKLSFLEENKTEKMKSINWNNCHRNFETYNNVVLDKITEINIVGIEKHPKVYDLTIPTTLNFGLANGLQVRDTSTTGYIQRRLIKGLEDLMVSYDMTVRTNKSKIVQFNYGDDNIDPIKVESQQIRLVEMSIQDIYAHYNIPDEQAKTKALKTIMLDTTLKRYTKQMKQTQDKFKKYTEMMIANRDSIIKNVFGYKSDSTVNLPVAFSYIINNVQGQQNITPNSMIDITPWEAFELIEENYSNLEKIRCAVPTLLFKTLYYFNLSPKELLFVKRFNRSALIVLLEKLTLDYKRAIVAPGEMVGMIAGQSIGEPTTQLSISKTTRHKVIKINKQTQKTEMMSIEVGKFCDELIQKLPEYTFNTGHIDSVETLLEPLDDEYYIIGVDAQERTHWNKISHISRHIVNGDMMKVITKSGRVVETTTSHSHLVRSNQTVVPIVGADMKTGMRIPVAKHIDNAFVQEHITIDGQTFQLNYLWGWFFGAYLSEGSLQKKAGTNDIAGGSITITNISEYYIENTKKIATLFGKEARVREKSGHILGSAKSYLGKDTIFSHKPLADFIMNTCGTGSFVKRVPDFAFLAPNEFKAGLIQGFWDGDGNFQNDKQHHQIRVLSRSEQLIKDMSLLLNYFDIFGLLKTTCRNGANYYHLSMSGRYAPLYQKHIGSVLHKESLQSLVDYTERENIHNLSDDIDKINGLGDIIAKCGKDLQLPGQSRNYGRWTKKEIQGIPIGRRTLQKYIEIFESTENSDIIKPELMILKQAANSNVIWDEIVNIEIYTPEQTEYVYDFTVPANQTFMTDYGVIVHNTLNSIVFETPIIVRNREGEIQKVKIGEFIEKHIATPKKLEYYADKDTTYAEMNEYYEVPSCDEAGRTLWKEIEAVTRHPVINEDGTDTMLKITTKGMREVIATKAKSFLQLIDGKIQGVNGSQLKVGDYLPCSKKPLDFKESYLLNLREFLPPTEYLYGSELEKAKGVYKESHWWLKHSGKTFILPHARSDSVVVLFNENVRKGRTQNKSQFIKSGCVYMKNITTTEYSIPENIPLDYNFGYLLGAYAAEGYMTKFQISIANNYDEYFKPILELCHLWNITTKVYRHENKGQEGWTSQDLRIYNTVLCRILENLCGKLSHNKFIRDKIVFSNKECLKGFLDAYIGGDGSIAERKNKDGTKFSDSINVGSVSYTMLLDIQVMLKNLGIVSNIHKQTKQTSNNRGTLPENIKQPYNLRISNQQSQKFAEILNITLQYKQEKAQKLLKQKFMYEYDKKFLTVPNIINGVLTFEERNDLYPDTVFDKIISIEEVSNTTKYAYDLTVADTRNFDIYNGISARDTFHSAGVSTKANVSRGVPRIEEILTLSSEPKNPSLTVYLKSEDERDREKAQTRMNLLEHTKMADIVKSIEICFDPDDLNTLIQEDASTMQQYRAFENMIDECNGGSNIEIPGNDKSKWILRMEMDPEAMLEKNITMDDINFTLKHIYKDEISCVFSDYNADKLVFRIRMNNIFKKLKLEKNIKVHSLDQSDQIYMLKNFQDQLLYNIIIRGVRKIQKVILRKIKDNVIESAGSYLKQDIWVLDTVGSNLKDVLALDYIDSTRTFSNDIVETYNVFGIEAARQTIFNELIFVMETDAGAYINYHHLSLLCDRMTFTSRMISIYRHGINNDNIGPIAKASFEETPEMFLKAARHAELDIMSGISANIMCGQEGMYGTNAFQIVLDINEMRKLEDIVIEKHTTEDELISSMFGLTVSDDKCSLNKLVIQNNVSNIKTDDFGTGGSGDYNPLNF